MKKLILLFAFSLSLTSCVAQKTEPIKNIDIPLMVNTIYGDQVEFQTENGHLLKAAINPNAVTFPKGLQLEEGRRYFVSFRYLDCDDCFKKKIYYDGFSVDPQQAQKDRASIIKQFQHPVSNE